ncbi:MAG: FecR domain-containing protein [Pseudomonadota bacterium]
MNDQSGQQNAKRKRAEEAAGILRRLDAEPDNRQAIQDRDAFVARGPEEKATYEKMARAFAAAPKGLRRRDRNYAAALLGAVLCSLYFAYEPLRISLLADITIAREPAKVALETGDVVALDASSAVRLDTGGDIRRVDLLKGTGFFDVDTSHRRFVVIAGDVRAEALGTEFEVARLGDDVVVTVAEGTVRVTHKGEEKVLQIGQQLRVSDSDGELRAIETDAIANWRDDRLTMDGMTFGEVAQIIGRRLPGATLVIGTGLAQEPVVGVLDLSSPEIALDTLALSGGARVLEARGFMTIIFAN